MNPAYAIVIHTYGSCYFTILGGFCPVESILGTLMIAGIIGAVGVALRMIGRHLKRRE
jgi:hypothetical protein